LVADASFGNTSSICDDLLEAPVTGELKDARNSLAVDWSDLSPARQWRRALGAAAFEADPRWKCWLSRGTPASV
jgi:hypothetical protein